MLTKQNKKEIISNLEKVIGDSNSVVFVNFHGLNTTNSLSMRRAMRGEGVGYTVARKTLIGRALDKLNPSGERPDLSGEVSLAYSTDLLAPARNVYQYQKKLGGKVSILGGIFKGEYKSEEFMVSMASIPSIEILRGMFANIINSPLQRMAIALDQIGKLKN